jgi:putative transposase
VPLKIGRFRIGVFYLNSKTVDMKKTRFTETQIVSILKQQEGGRSVKDICREHSISDATFYNWKSKYGGMEASDVKRMKDLEEENARLKKMYANLAMDNEILRDLFTKKGWALPPKGN